MEVHYNFVTQALLGYIRTRVEHQKMCSNVSETCQPEIRLCSLF